MSIVRRRTWSLLNLVRCSALLKKNNEAMIKMIIKGRSPTTRHVCRTHWVAHDWLFDRINLYPKIQIKHVDTKHQLADMFTKENFTRDKWNNLLRFFDTSRFSLNCCSQNFSLTSRTETMAKRTQEEKRWREDGGKVKADGEPGLTCLDKLFDFAKSDCVEKPGDTQGTLSKRLEEYRETGGERT